MYFVDICEGGATPLYFEGILSLSTVLGSQISTLFLLSDFGY